MNRRRRLSKHKGLAAAYPPLHHSGRFAERKESMMPLASSPAAFPSAHPPYPFCGGASGAGSSSHRKSAGVISTANKKRHRLLALPEPQAAAVSVLVAGIVGFSATLLLRRSSSQEQEQGQKGGEEAGGEECWDCGGTGLCGLCKGEGFVFKQLSEDTATKARKAAKNMATRYTAGLPTKWTYCNKCSSTRSCTTCRGSGRITANLTSTSSQ